VIVMAAIYAACSETECFAYKNGLCAVLVNNNFSGRTCPFRKTEEQLVEERKRAEKRLERLGEDIFYDT